MSAGQAKRRQAAGPRSAPAIAVLACGSALFLFLLLAAPKAPASYDPLGSGTTRLSFSKEFLSLMKAHGVAAIPKASATRKGRAVVFPVDGGKMDPTSGKGEIDQLGNLTFRRGARSVPFRKLMVKAKRAPLYAKVGGSQLKVATGARISTVRDGFGTIFTAKDLKLTEKVAVRLNKKLHLGDVFEAGQMIGSLRSATQPQTTAILPTGRATLAVAPEMLARLSELHVSLNPIFPAELAPGPLFTLPMTPKGALAPDASLGTLRTGGAIELLQLGAGQIFWHELWFGLDAGTALSEVDLQPSPPYGGKLGQVGVLDLDMSSAATSSNAKARTITVTGATLRLQSQSAESFNQAFGERKAVFKAGDLFGTISFTAQGQ
jgi:hypothetical protein